MTFLFIKEFSSERCTTGSPERAAVTPPRDREVVVILQPSRRAGQRLHAIWDVLGGGLLLSRNSAKHYIFQFITLAPNAPGCGLEPVALAAGGKKT
jgi:hypothetical protein